MGKPVKRSINVAGHATSISLEAPFWEALRRIAGARGCSISALIEEVDRTRDGGLSSSIRLFVLAEVQKQAG